MKMKRGKIYSVIVQWRYARVSITMVIRTSKNSSSYVLLYIFLLHDDTLENREKSDNLFKYRKYWATC